MTGTLYFHNANDYSGSTRVLADVILEREGSAPVTVLTRNDSGRGFLSDMPNVRIVNTYLRPRVAGHRIPIISESVWRVFSFCLALWFGRDYDTFYINTIMPCYAALAGRLSGKRIIYHVHEYFVVHKPGTRRAERIFLLTPSERIFVSEYLRNCYPDNGYPATVRYNRLSPDFVSRIKARPLSERALDTIIMISAPTREKGADNFVKLAGMLPEFKFIMVAGDTEEKTASFFGNALPSNMRVFPMQKDVNGFLEKSDLLVSLTNPNLCVETFGMTLIEAMAYGLPVLAPAAGGPPEIVLNAGICMDVTDLPAVTAEIRRILSDKDLYESMSDAAFSRASKFKG